MAKKVYTEIPLADVKFLDSYNLNEITPTFDNTDADESDLYVLASVNSLFNALIWAHEEQGAVTKKQTKEFIETLLTDEELEAEIIKTVLKHMLDFSDGGLNAIIRAAKLSWDEVKGTYRW